MKTSFLVIILIVLSSTYSIYAQSENLESGNVERIAQERKKATEELTQLRDSLQITVGLLTGKIKKSSTLFSSKHKRARKELVAYQDQLKLSLEEVNLTSENGWSKESVGKVDATIAPIRINHKRIQKLVATAKSKR